MRDPHQGIVNDHRVVVGGDAVGSDEHWITDDLRREPNLAANDVVEDDIATFGHPEAHDGFLAVVDSPSRVVLRDVAAAANVLRWPSFLERGLAIGFELLGRAETVIRPARCHQLDHVGAIDVQALRLVIRAMIAAGLDALVPRQAQPPKVGENRVGRLARRALEVRVLDAEDERPAVAAGEQPVEQRRAGVADVELAGGTWRKPNTHYGFQLRTPPGIPASSATACTAIDSPAPIESTPSLVFPLTLTWPGPIPSAPERFRCMAP